MRRARAPCRPCLGRAAARRRRGRCRRRRRAADRLSAREPRSDPRSARGPAAASARGRPRAARHRHSCAQAASPAGPTRSSASAPRRCTCRSRAASCPHHTRARRINRTGTRQSDAWGCSQPRTPERRPMSASHTELETVNVRLADGAATVELNRPERLNAWNGQLGADLLSALRAAAADDSVRAIILTGAGRAFSSGADLREVGGGDATPEERPDVYTMLTERYHPIIETIREIGKPVVASVNGAAAGIGCSLALCCDLILAAESAYFLLAFVNIGLAPDGGSSVFVPARVGMTRATEMAMLGERVAAKQALEWGLINRVVPDAELAAETSTLAARLASGPTRSYAAAKRQVNNWVYSRMAEQLELEARIQQEMAGSEDFVEGVAAFVQKRPARFSGS